MVVFQDAGAPVPAGKARVPTNRKQDAVLEEEFG